MSNFEDIFQGRISRDELVEEARILFGDVPISGEILLGLSIKKLLDRIEILEKDLKALK